MTPHEFGKKCAHDFLTKYARKGDPSWGDFLGELGQSFNPWNGREVGGVGSYIDKWYNPWTQNTDPMSRGEAPLMWIGRGAMGTAAAAGTAAGGLAAAPALGLGGGTAAGGTGTGAATTAAAAAAKAGWGSRLLNGLILGDIAHRVYTGGSGDGDQQQQQPPTPTTSPLGYAALGGLAGAGLGGVAGAFMPGERIETDPATGWPIKKKRTALRGGLRGSVMGGLAGTALGGLYGALQQQKQSAAYAFGQRAGCSL